jgi:hypothetical protein
MFDSTARSRVHAATTIAMAIALAVALAGCGSRHKGAAAPASASRPSCRDGAGDDVEVGARTAGSGVKTFGKATAGLVEGGTDEAKTRWKEGAAQTKATAKEGGAETKQEGEVPRCR